ncbi:MAG: hypothetical protein MSH60_07905, partial [Ruminococcus sp.]|nr:hypothetical protein [Ruminococcus sp.]
VICQQQEFQFLCPNRPYFPNYMIFFVKIEEKSPNQFSAKKIKMFVMFSKTENICPNVLHLQQLATDNNN